MQEESKKVEMDFKQSLFASYANIAIVEVRLYNESERLARLTHKEMLYMYCIWSKPDWTATDLVEMFDNSKALVSQTILGMEEKGYIAREKDPKDNRRQILRITDDKVLEAREEMEFIDAAVKKLASKYTKEEIEKASKIIFDFTEELLFLATGSEKQWFHHHDRHYPSIMI